MARTTGRNPLWKVSEPGNLPASVWELTPGRPLADAAEYVLAPFKRKQEKELEELVGLAADAVRSVIAEGVEKAMTKFNRRAQS